MSLDVVTIGLMQNIHLSSILKDVLLVLKIGILEWKGGKNIKTPFSYSVKGHLKGKERTMKNRLKFIVFFQSVSVSFLAIFFGLTLAVVATHTRPGFAQANKPVGTSDGEQPGMRLEVQELKRTSGGTVNLKFVVINDSDKDLGANFLFSTDAAQTLSNVALIDEANKKKYYVVRDSENKCLCSSDFGHIKAKNRVNLWAKFPAPPEDVKKMTVVIPHFAPIDDVPISR